MDLKIVVSCNVRTTPMRATLCGARSEMRVLLRMMKDLVTRTSLIIGIFGGPGASNCRDDEHQQIVGALLARDGQKAVDLMTAHLHHIASHLDLEAKSSNSVDLVSLFAGH